VNKPVFFSKAVLPYAFWWGLWILLHTLVLHRLYLTWEVAFTDALISNITLALAGFVITNTYRFYTPGQGNYLYRFGYILIAAIACVMGTKWLLQMWFKQDVVYLMYLEISQPVRYLFALLMIAFITVVSWLRFTISDEKQYKKRKDEAEKLLREAELSKLRQQLQPHFLFNSLNSISALAGSQPEAARKMIQQLSDFLRGTLKKDEQQLVNFSDEMEHLLLYLEIEKVRFGHRLNTAINIDEHALQLKIPSLLLQPLVENAIKFGLYDTIGNVTISINARLLDNLLYISIENPYDPETTRPLSGTGFGLDSVFRRLFLLYGRTDLLNTNQIEKQFITTLEIPQ
jgi:LytS/YehU family sensor histidine kinase